MISDKIVIIYAQDYLPDNAAPSYPPEDLNIPLGILYLGSHLNSIGRRVKLMDTRIHKKGDFFKALQDELDDCLLAGFSVTTPCVKNALEISDFIKKLKPSVKTVWGGVHASLYPDATASSGLVDYVIVKEGELPLSELAKYLLGNKKEITGIPNLVFKIDGSIKRNTVQDNGRLGFIGVADYALLDMEKYVEKIIAPNRRRRQVEVLTARGCPYRCAFCVNTILYDRKWRSEPPDLTLEKLDRLIGDYKIDHVFFMDEDFFCNRNRTKSLIADIGKRKITWEANCRADYIKDDYLDDNLLDSLKKSGCVKLRFGLESGSQRVLDLLKKDITVEDSLNMAKRLSRYGIVPAASFMMGLPDETAGDVIKTTDLISRLSAVNPDIMISGPAIFRPYPGSELFRRCEEKGLVAPKTLDEWSDFYMHNNFDEYHNGVPWFDDVYIFKRVWLCLAHLRIGAGNKLFRWLARLIVRFHLATKLKFVESEYLLHKFIKNI
ncbi:MAG: radical SAM protein [Candidatus Omnitrophica bacterium]|nr:radical SAM protein [Candidatus Omnitrophota bacterium]